jgi:hypothetical protein
MTGARTLLVVAACLRARPIKGKKQSAGLHAQSNGKSVGVRVCRVCKFN